MQVAREIDQSFANLTIGSPAVHLNFALFPLFEDGKGPRPTCCSTTRSTATLRA